jgi:hypothetical protein
MGLWSICVQNYCQGEHESCDLRYYVDSYARYMVRFLALNWRLDMSFIRFYVCCHFERNDSSAWKDRRVGENYEKVEVQKVLVGSGRCCLLTSRCAAPQPRPAHAFVVSNVTCFRLLKTSHQHDFTRSSNGARTMLLLTGLAKCTATIGLDITLIISSNISVSGTAPRTILGLRSQSVQIRREPLSCLFCIQDRCISFWIVGTLFHKGAPAKVYSVSPV